MNTYVVTIFYQCGYDTDYNVKTITTNDGLEDVVTYFALEEYDDIDTSYSVYTLEDWVQRVQYDSWEDEKKEILQRYEKKKKRIELTKQIEDMLSENAKGYSDTKLEELKKELCNL